MNAPDAERKILVLIAGALWSIVGLWLLWAAARWIIPNVSEYNILLIAAGFATGLIIYRFGFSRLVATNISRIFSQAPGKEKVCIFSFQNTKSYIMIMIMIGLGYILRHLPVSKLYIAPVYIAIGLALLLSSLIYYRRMGDHRE
jgi:hypothetical protein